MARTCRKIIILYGHEHWQKKSLHDDKLVPIIIANTTVYNTPDALLIKMLGKLLIHRTSQIR